MKDHISLANSFYLKSFQWAATEMLKGLGDGLCSVSCLVLGVGNTLTLQEREFI